MDYLKLISSKIKENPGALFGILYPYFLVLVVVIGLYYVSKLDIITRQNIPAVIPDTTVILDLPLMEARTVPAIDINVLAEPNSELLETGKNLFVTMCASCHGEDGKGNGPGAAALNPPPRNFANEEGWKNGSSLSGIYTSLQEGIPGTGMIPYAILTPKDKFSLVHYIRKEFVTNPPQDSPGELTALDQLYNLSAGTNIPAQIPVKSAMQIFVSENLNSIERVQNSYTQIQKDPSNDAKIFIKVTDDQLKALSFLITNDVWKDKNSFKNLVTGSLNTNGFNGHIFNLTDGEWSELFSFIKNNI